MLDNLSVGELVPKTHELPPNTITVSGSVFGGQVTGTNKKRITINSEGESISHKLHLPFSERSTLIDVINSQAD